jgi:hypothetical protein
MLTLALRTADEHNVGVHRGHPVWVVRRWTDRGLVT